MVYGASKFSRNRPPNVKVQLRATKMASDSTRPRAAAKDGDLLLAQAISSPRFNLIRQSPHYIAAMRRCNLDLSRVTAPDGDRSR